MTKTNKNNIPPCMEANRLRIKELPQKYIISIIVPIYNVSKYLDKCLNSIQCQSFRDFEVLMIDDGSTDDSAVVAQRYLTDERFKYYYQNNMGQGAARNYGLDLSKGEYVCFIDSDDYIEEEFLNCLYKILIDNNADISQCSVARVWENGYRRRYEFTGLITTSYVNIKNYIMHSSFVVWNKLYKKDLFTGIRFPINIKFEDFVLSPQIYDRAKLIVSTEKVLYNYLYRNNSTINEKKIHEDILVAYHLLERSTFGERNPEIMAAFFVRQIMGSLIWSMAPDKKYVNKIRNLVEEGKTKYPNLKSIIGNYIGKHKSFFGNQLLKGNYKLAFLYAILFNHIFSFKNNLLKFKILLTNKITFR